MIRLACRLARLGDVALPAWLTADPGQLAEIYRLGSSGDIALAVDSSRLAGPPVWPGSQVGGYRLQRVLQSLTVNPPPPGRVSTIAVLFTGSYLPNANVLGVMFDEGRPTPDNPSTSEDFLAHPREGCAVFLDSIRAWRSRDADFEVESLFTTVHEMGHIFNLQHVEDACWLASSRSTAPFGADHHRFTAAQAHALAACSTSDNIRPGGARFGDTGVFGVANAIRPARFGIEGLTLSVELPADAFWPFEPIELDIAVKAAKDARRAFRIPDRIDPGYETFRIWIEAPDGERRLYRSPRRYCSRPRRRTLAPGETFRRDVSLFREAGGLTFRRAGPHRVWAEFEVRAGAWIRSKAVEFEVRSAEDSAFYAAARATLGSASSSRLLYHRQLRRDLRAASLEAFVAAYPDWPGVERVRYGIGRARLRAAEEQAGERSREQRRRGRDQLLRAMDGEGLGETQRRWATTLLESAG